VSCYHNPSWFAQLERERDKAAQAAQEESTSQAPYPIRVKLRKHRIRGPDPLLATARMDEISGK